MYLLCVIIIYNVTYINIYFLLYIYMCICSYIYIYIWIFRPFPGSVLLCSEHHFFFWYTQIWHSWKCTPSEDKSCKIVDIILSKIKCTPHNWGCLWFTLLDWKIHWLKSYKSIKLIGISIKVISDHQYYIAKNEVYSFINFNTCLFHKILSIMNRGVHFQEYYI